MDNLLSDLDRVKVIKYNDDPLSDEELRRLQLVELGLIAEVDRVCRANNIKYSIFCGTMLGAVRHQGYIPWDDDADIAMLRDEYEKFKKVSDQLNPEICFFQDHDTDPNYLWGYGKVRKVGTYHMRKGQEHINCKNGVYIDIFPLDDVPNFVPWAVLQDFGCYCIRQTLWSKVGRYSSKGFKRAWYSLISHISLDAIYRFLNRCTRNGNNPKKRGVRCLLFPAFGKLYLKTNPLSIRYGLKREWFLDLDEYTFEKHSFLGTKEYDEILKYIYDDYMTPPPVEKRVPKVSFSHIEF